MQISVFAVGKKMPVWVELACTEYSKRLPRHWHFSIREFAQAKVSGSKRILSQEADSLLSAVPDKCHVIALDQQGFHWSTEQVADQMQRWQTTGKDVIFLIGGAEGLHPNCKARANQMWSLSMLTFPHPLVRVILTEQLYRAQSLLDNHPYHRA